MTIEDLNIKSGKRFQRRWQRRHYSKRSVMWIFRSETSDTYTYTHTPNIQKGNSIKVMSTSAKCTCHCIAMQCNIGFSVKLYIGSFSHQFKEISLRHQWMKIIAIWLPQQFVFTFAAATIININIKQTEEKYCIVDGVERLLPTLSIPTEAVTRTTTTITKKSIKGNLEKWP